MGKAKDATFEKSSFNTIFKIASKMYSESESHKMYAGMQNYSLPVTKVPFNDMQMYRLVGKFPLC